MDFWSQSPTFGHWTLWLVLLSFPVAATTNHHELYGLKQPKLIIFQFWSQKSKLGLTGLESRCWLDCVALWSFWGEFLLLLLLLLLLSHFSHVRLCATP